ncbi:MAG: hypothetical protein IPK13_11355 [Deltaproteobacteria bacterium]|nr:hypothetical protein [Deltaproteobacteria bacterium]
MAKILSDAASTSKAFLYTRPDGHAALTAHIAVNDAAIRGSRPDFDGMEQVTGYFPLTGQGAWAAAPAQYQGTTRSHMDLHSLSVDVGAAHVDVPALLGKGFAWSAQVSGPTAGTESIQFQTYGNNTRVYDVGRVDEHGIGWVGPVVATRIQGTGQSPTPLNDGDTVRFDSYTFGAPGNLRFDLEVFAPELSPLAGVEDRAKRQEILEKMDMRVDSDFLPADARNHLLEFSGNTGPDGNNARLGFSLADGIFINRYPPSGVYEFRILKGGEPIRSFKLDWRDS